MGTVAGGKQTETRFRLPALGLQALFLSRFGFIRFKSEMNESHLSEFSFERRFDVRGAMAWMQNNW